MTTRRPYQLALAGALVMAALLGAFLLLKPQPEPVYNGKTLSEWIAVSDDDPAEKARKAAAISHLGTNAVPFLLEWIQYEPQPKAWRARLYSLQVALGWKIQSKAVEKWRRAENASKAFQYLGSDARGMAIPELRNLAIVRKPCNTRAMQALSALRMDGLPSLIEALGYPDLAVTESAIWAIGKMGTNALPAIPVLVNLLTNSDVDTAMGSLMSLGGLKLEPNLVVPALTNALLATGIDQGSVLYVLGQYGRKAQAAVPLLQEYLMSPSEHLRRSATNALRKINPEALRRATEK